MPRLTVWFLRTALINLLLGFTFGALLLMHKAMLWFPWAWQFLPAHVDLLLLGWMGELAMGVAFWILPRFGTRRGAVWLAWLAWGSLNAGIALILVAASVQASMWLWFVARTLEAISVLAFAIHAWPRVKPAMASI